MSPTLIPIRSAETMALAIHLYEAAFPPEERRPTNEWLALMNDQTSAFTALSITDDDGRFLGFITTWGFDAFIYVEHFAILPEGRGHGLGSRVLQALETMADGKPIVLEVEPPEDEMAIRRINFYERIGFHLQSIPYVQPAYASNLPSIELCLMSTTQGMAYSCLQSVIQVIHRNVYGIR